MTSALWLQVARQPQAASMTAAIVMSLQAGHTGDTDVGISAAEAVVVMTAGPMTRKRQESTSIGDVAEPVARTAGCTSRNPHANTNGAAGMILAVDVQGKAQSAAGGGTYRMRAVSQSLAVKTHENVIEVVLAVVQDLMKEWKMLLKL